MDMDPHRNTSLNRQLVSVRSDPVSPPAPSLPSGYAFHPTERQLILKYLKNKAERKPMPFDIIPEIRLYDENPETIAARIRKCNSKEWFFFTPRDKRYKMGKRPNRSARGGFWKATAGEKPIRRRNTVIGHKMVLVFFEGEYGKGKKTNWILYEYRLEAPTRVRQNADDMRLDDFVLCKMYNKKSMEDDEEEEQNAGPQEQPNHENAVVVVNEETDWDGVLEELLQDVDTPPSGEDENAVVMNGEFVRETENDTTMEIDWDGLLEQQNDIGEDEIAVVMNGEAVPENAVVVVNEEAVRESENDTTMETDWFGLVEELLQDLDTPPSSEDEIAVVMNEEAVPGTENDTRTEIDWVGLLEELL